MLQVTALAILSSAVALFLLGFVLGRARRRMLASVHDERFWAGITQHMPPQVVYCSRCKATGGEECR